MKPDPTPWELFAPHRARVTQALIAAAPARGGALTLLGAGHCRDVDLTAALRVFATVALVDRNAEALAAARAHHPPDLQRRILMYDVELGGASPDETPARLARALPPADVVASTCLLSQLCFQTAEAIGRDRPEAEAACAAVVIAHLRGLLALAAPGGAAVLVDDIATAPRGELEARVLGAGPASVAAEVDAARERLRHRMPAALRALLAEDPVLRAEIAASIWLEPWLWTRTAEQTYLVHAFVLRRRGAG